MENLQPKQPENQPQNNQQNKPISSPFVPPAATPSPKPFEKKTETKTETKTEKKTETKVVKTDDKPYAAWAIGALIILAIAFYGYYARQESQMSDTDEDGEELVEGDNEENTDEEADEVIDEDEATEDEGEVLSESSEDTGSSAGGVALTPTFVWPVRTFNSANLGVGFDYALAPGITPAEEGNRILVNALTIIEVFEKDEDDTLREAVMKEFAGSINSANCFVVDTTNSAMEGYVKVGIYAAPGVTGCGPAGWNNRDSYFLMNTEAPEKFVAVYSTAANVTIEE
jgi:hypothetical protein